MGHMIVLYSGYRMYMCSFHKVCGALFEGWRVFSGCLLKHHERLC